MLICVFSHIMEFWSIVLCEKSNLLDMKPADRLKIARKKLKLTQEKFAISVGLKRDNVTGLELGKVRFSTLHALAIEYVHGINKDWLLSGDGEMFLQQANTSSTGESEKVVKVLTEHPDLVKRFKDPEQGLLNNLRLIDLEKISKRLYDKMSEDIQKVHETAMILKEEIDEEFQKKENQKKSSGKRKANGR